MRVILAKFYLDLGNIPNNNTWTSTWEECFTNAMREMLRWEMQAHEGHSTDSEIRELSNDLVHKVIPRLIRPMETGGLKIIPCLLHCDLWPGNAKHHKSDDRMMFYDSGACWGHNEGSMPVFKIEDIRSLHSPADLAEFRAPRYQLGPEYMEAYHRIIKKSEPVADWKDRNHLYAM